MLQNGIDCGNRMCTLVRMRHSVLRGTNEISHHFTVALGIVQTVCIVNGEFSYRMDSVRFDSQRQSIYLPSRTYS